MSQKSSLPSGSFYEKSGSIQSAQRIEKPKKAHSIMTSHSITQIGSQPSMNRVNSTKIASRVDSSSSISSMGIGTGGNLANQADTVLVKVLPAGTIPEGRTIYDCIVYLFYCPVHDRFAIASHGRVVWLPFAVLQANMTNIQAASEGMAIFLGCRDREADGDQTFMKMPNTSLQQFFHILHIQLVTSGQSCHRFAYFVQVDPTEGYQCCQPSARLTWIQTNDILQDQIEGLWGPEVKLFIQILIQPVPVYIEEFTREHALYLLTVPDRKLRYQSKMLSSCNLNQDQILALFENYVEHCFPSTYMSVESFKCYLIKYGYSQTDPRFPWLFNAIAYNKKGYIDFNEFLVGLLCLEPSTDHIEGRFRLLFRYYDVDQDDYLNVDEFLCLLRDTNPQATSAELYEFLEQARQYGMQQGRLSYDEFQKAIQSGKLHGTDSLCRSPKPIISKAVIHGKRSLNSSSEKVTNMATSNQTKIQKRRKAKGVCTGCREQKIDFCLHTVYLDMASMCQKPMRIKEG